MPDEAEALRVRLASLDEQRSTAVRARHFDARELWPRSDAAQAAVRGTLAGPLPQLHFMNPEVVWSPLCLAAMRDESNLARLLPPDDLTAEALHGAVKLAWRPAARGNVAIHHWELMRAAPGAEYTLLAEVTVGQTNYTDATATPGVVFSYRVVSACADALLAATLPRSAQSAPVSAGSEADIRWRALSTDGVGARFLVERWHGSAFVAQEFVVQPGERVGAVDAQRGIDFSTEVVLEAVATVLETRRRTVSAVSFDAAARVVLVDGRPQTVSVEREEQVPVRSLRLRVGAETREIRMESL